MGRNSKNLYKPVFIAAVFMAAMYVYIPVSAQSAPISLPKGAVEGRLPNGLHYLILENAVPESRAEFRLIMRVGSVQETEEQKGCAHFIEHMAFGGTRHFPKRSLVSYLESKGMKYGTDINAFTGYDRTIYMFAVPTDRGQEAAIDSSLLIVRDWLDGISFLPEKVENEKGIILEELRGYDLNDDFYQLKIGQGVFADHIPLGAADDIRKASPQALKEYYKKWYTPSLAALVVVGDVSPREIEAKIKDIFSSLKKRAAEDFRIYPLEYAEGIQISEARDSLRNRTKVELIIPHPCVVERTMDDAVRKGTGRLLVSAITQRFRGRRIEADLSDSWYLSDKNHLALTVEGHGRREILNAITAAVAELNCLVSEGWGEEELSDVRSRFCDRMTEGAPGGERLSADLCEDFTDYVISGDRYMTDPAERKQLKEAMMRVQSGDLQSLLKEWLACQKRVLLVACNSHPGLGAPLAREEIAGAWAEGERATCAPYAYARREAKEDAPVAAPACLAVRHPYDSTAIAHVDVYGGMGIKDVLLENGIRLIMKPTQDPDSILYLASFAPFGTSSLSDEEYPLLEGAGGYIDMGGIAKVDGDSLSEYLFQKGMSITIAMESHWHGFMGMSSTADAPEFFNLIYEKIFDPELRYDDFEEIRQGLMQDDGQETMLEKMLKRDPGRRLSARIDELMGAAIARPAIRFCAERLSLDSMAGFYKSLYTRPEGTTYVVCGNFDPDSLMRQFASVFGRIPASENTAQYAYPNVELPDKALIESFPNENETQAAFDYLLFGHYEPCLKNTLTLKLMRDVVRNRLISVLRERESLIYSPYVSLFYEGIPWRKFYFDINASADNKNMERIGRLLKEIIQRLKDEETDMQELQPIKRSFLLAKREALNEKSPAAWRAALVGLLKNGESLADFERYEQCLDEITPADLRKAFGEWVRLDNYALLYLSNDKLNDK